MGEKGQKVWCDKAVEKKKKVKKEKKGVKCGKPS